MGFKIEDKKKKGRKLSERVDELYLTLTDKHMIRLAEVIASPRKLFWRSFMAGIARGVGSAIGFSLLSAVIIYLLRYIVMLNLPLIGAFLRDIWKIVQGE